MKDRQKAVVVSLPFDERKEIEIKIVLTVSYLCTRKTRL